MKTLLTMLSVMLLVTAPSFAGNQIEAWLEEAVRELNASGNLGDTSAPQRRLREILKEDPTHLEALWILTNLELSKLTNLELTEHIKGLFKTGQAIEKIVVLAKKKGQPAFAHYVTARYAKEYKTYTRALSEINSALFIEPNSTRFLATKGKILVGKGSWEDNDQGIEAGIRILKQAHKQSKENPTIFYDEESFHFALAWATAKLSKPRWEEVIEHYVSAIRHGPEKTIPQAFAWNNVSIAYQKLGQCQKAREAAEHALEIMEFGAAESNKQYAEFCLEMQQLGIMSSHQKKHPASTGQSG